MKKLMKKKLLVILLTAVMCMGTLAGCGFGKTEKKEDVTLIIKVPPLAMNAVANPEMDVAEAFLQAAGEAFAAQYASPVTVSEVSASLEKENFKWFIYCQSI